MTINEALGVFLLADGTITALVSTRVYHGHAPSGAVLPYIVFRQLGAEHIGHFTGRSGFVRYRIEITPYAAGGEAAAAIVERLRLRLDHVKTSYALGYTAEAYLTDEGLRLVIPPGKQEPIYGYAMQFDMWAREAA